MKYGTITSYAWNFGDGVTATTATPTTTHTYATGGNYPVSVTETDSAGTSTARVFTGQTMSRNGGPQATATATASIEGPAAWTAYVVNNLDNTVTPINLRTLVAGPAIPVGAGPDAVAITPDAKTAYVANGDANTVTPINTATNSPGPAIPVGSDPFSIAITPDGTTAWVANSGDGTVTPINVATNTAGAPITIPLGVSGVTVSPDGATLYVTGDPNVTPVNLATNTVGASFVNAGNPRATAITPNGAKLLTANGNNFVAVHDTTTNANTTDFVLNALAGDVAITPNGATAYVAYTAPGEGGLVPIDIATGNPGAKIKTGQAGFGTAITPDGKTAIVTNLFDHSVTLVSTATNTVGATIQVGTNPFAVAVTPDQAPIARLHVARAPLGQPATLDASASTTPFGTRTAYLWDFGDGTKAIDAVADHAARLQRGDRHRVGDGHQLGEHIDGADVHRSDGEQQRRRERDGVRARIARRQRPGRQRGAPGGGRDRRRYPRDHHRFEPRGHDERRVQRQAGHIHADQQHVAPRDHACGGCGADRRRRRDDGRGFVGDVAGRPVHLHERDAAGIVLERIVRGRRASSGHPGLGVRNDEHLVRLVHRDRVGRARRAGRRLRRRAAVRGDDELDGPRDRLCRRWSPRSCNRT